MKKRNIKYVNNRILEISEDSKQITLPDSRYYRRNGEYYPSITHVLGSYPKGKHFEEWLKNMGRSADYIVRKAAEDGTKVHEMMAIHNLILIFGKCFYVLLIFGKLKNLN